jgi:hypothetical protein
VGLFQLTHQYVVNITPVLLKQFLAMGLASLGRLISINLVCKKKGPFFDTHVKAKQ